MISYEAEISRYSIVAAQESLAASEIYTRPVNVIPGSGASLELSHGWLESCLSTHNQCTKPTGTFMPSRCIEMSTLAGRPVLRLRKCAETGVRPFVALSYCWGHNQQYVTTQSTLSQHSEQIIASKLPATLLNAIEVAMGLGIDYLWVDSLFIVQDDAADKAKEIDLMPMIYSEAVVTIAASRASDVTEGFLHPRIYIRNISQVPYIVSRHQIASVFLLEDIDEEVEPLDLRAWAM